MTSSTLLLQLSLADSEKHIIVYYALQERNWNFHVECDVSSINRRFIRERPYQTRLKPNFDRLLYIIFFITQIHTVCLVSINGEASRVRLQINFFFLKLEKKILKKKLKKKKKFWEIILKQKFSEKNLKKNFFFKRWKKFWQKIFGKINYKTKISIKNFIATSISGTLFFPC